MPGTAGADRQLVDRPDALPDQLRPLVEAHARDEHQVAVLGDLGGQAAQRPQLLYRVTPRDRLVSLQPFVDHPQEFGALRAVHRGDVDQVVRARRAVAEHQVHLLPGRDAVRPICSA